MAGVPHLRLSMNGDLPSGEQFSCSLSLRPDTSAWSAAVLTAARIALLNAFLGSSDMSAWDDVVSDCSNFWARSNSHIAPNAVLKRIKMAAIDENGHYTGSPKEAAVNIAGADNTGQIFPHQMARKITLETDGDLGRIKGGFYLPGCVATGWSSDTDLYSTGQTGEVRGSVATLISDLNNAPGVDVSALKVVIASGGRHNSNGSVRVAAALWDVERVNVGRRIDVQRRRANKLSEARISDSVVE